MQDLLKYLDEIVDPTIAEFARNPTSVRHAFIACTVTFHAVDYMAHPKSSRALRQEWGREFFPFRVVDSVAHAFKHVETRSGQSVLSSANVISRPPAVAGLLVPNLSIVGDAVGAVTLRDNIQLNLLEIVQDAARFLRKKTES